MSLSKKNLDKLNTFIKNNNYNCNNNILTSQNSNRNHEKSKNITESEDPRKIFYSLIDNSESLDETCEVNHLLRESEENSNNIRSRDSDYSKYLTAEDELYDEFNYLLEE